MAEKIQELVAADLALKFKKIVDGDTLEERLQQFVEGLADKKVVAFTRVGSNGKTELVCKTNPFIGMQDGTDRYNRIATKTVSLVLHADVKMTSSRMAGNFCDVFEIQ